MFGVLFKLKIWPGRVAIKQFISSEFRSALKALWRFLDSEKESQLQTRRSNKKQTVVNDIQVAEIPVLDNNTCASHIGF